MGKDMMLILKKDVINMIFKCINGYNLDNYYSINYNSIIFKIINELGMQNFSLLFGKWKKEIKKYNFVILFDDGYNEGISKYIKRHNKNCKTCLYYWNTINEFNKKYLDDKNIDEIYTFDEKDAKKYKLKYYPQFYTKQIKLNEVEKENDVIFLGRAKNRKREIEKIANKIKQQGISTKFYIIEKDKNLIDYQEYLKMVEKSKCILDIVNNEQSGLTLRCMEALFLKKKLITNNKEIKNYDFYNSNNVFIIGENNIENIKEFVDGRYTEIPTYIIDKYDFKTWLDNFTKG